MIFVSYRRNDTAYFAGRLTDRLIDTFGKQCIFQDVIGIDGGTEFKSEIDRRLTQAKVVLVVIGPEWAGQSGVGKRIDNSEDMVRYEVAKALVRRPKLRVIPVFLNESLIFEDASGLPADLKPILDLNARVVRPGVEFDDDLRRLLSECKRVLYPGFLARTGFNIRSLLARNYHWILACTLFIFLLLWFRNPIAAHYLIGKSGVADALEKHDRDVFLRKHQDSLALVARVLPDRASLTSETDLASAVRSTKKTLDVHSIAATAFLNDDENLRLLLNAGVKIRLLLVDHSNENKENLTRYFENRDGKGLSLNESRSKFELSLSRVARLNQEVQGANRGNIEIKLWRGAYGNSFWIRDGRLSENSMGHIEIGFHGDADLNPSVRFGQFAIPMIMNLQGHFDRLWTSPLAVSID